MIARLFPSTACVLLAAATGLNAISATARADDPKLPEMAASPRQFNVRDFGAVGDGKAVDTAAIRRAIQACADAGGGQVVVPAGTYLSGPLQLRSNLDFHMEAGAEILFSPNRMDYDLVFGSFEGKQTVICMSPLTADGVHDVSITGSGTFDGHGDRWRQTKRSKLTPAQWNELVASGGVLDQREATWYPSKEALEGVAGLAKLRAGDAPPRIEDYQPYRDLLRPPLLQFSNCQRLLLDGPTFRNSPAWNLHPILCEDVTIRNVTAYNPEYAQNGDGIDIDSCRNVLVADSTIDAGDDAICLKSGRDAEGRKLGRPCEHITITRCKIGTGHGGISIGSEMSGGVRDVRVSHCTMDGTDTGVRLKTTRGRGNVVEDISVSDITMSHINQSAIEFNMYYMIKGTPKAEPVGEGTPCFRNIQLTRIKCEGAAQAIIIRGLPEMPIESITITDADIVAKSAGEITYAKDVTLTNVQLHTGNSTLKIENSQGVKSDQPLVVQ
ncbi:MAG TPA: glycoside hydrolase family 28 protein [Phycisphaerae bacterium]|nr:glycoside hydrolase family 28 protein [Phycisphaerae bacterium]